MNNKLFSNIISNTRTKNLVAFKSNVTSLLNSKLKEALSKQMDSIKKNFLKK